MYQFTDQGRKALEQLSLPLCFFQQMDGQNIPLLVSDGFCDMMGISREQMLKEQRWSKFDRIHPEDVGKTSQAVRNFWAKKANYDVLYRVRYADNEYHYVHSVAFWWPVESGTELILVIYLDLQRWQDSVKQAADSYVFLRPEG